MEAAGQGRGMGGGGDWRQLVKVGNGRWSDGKVGRLSDGRVRQWRGGRRGLGFI